MSMGPEASARDTWLVRDEVNRMCKINTPPYLMHRKDQDHKCDVSGLVTVAVW